MMYKLVSFGAFDQVAYDAAYAQYVREGTAWNERSAAYQAYRRAQAEYDLCVQDARKPVQIFGVGSTAAAAAFFQQKCGAPPAPVPHPGPQPQPPRRSDFQRASDDTVRTPVPAEPQKMSAVAVGGILLLVLAAAGGTAYYLRSRA